MAEARPAQGVEAAEAAGSSPDSSLSGAPDPVLLGGHLDGEPEPLPLRYPSAARRR